MNSAEQRCDYRPAATVGGCGRHRGRGGNVTALGHVVNFDVPLASEDDIHRVGRTGRAEPRLR